MVSLRTNLGTAKAGQTTALLDCPALLSSFANVMASESALTTYLVLTWCSTGVTRCVYHSRASKTIREGSTAILGE